MLEHRLLEIWKCAEDWKSTAFITVRSIEMWGSMVLLLLYLENDTRDLGVMLFYFV